MPGPGFHGGLGPRGFLTDEEKENLPKVDKKLLFRFEKTNGELTALNLKEQIWICKKPSIMSTVSGDANRISLTPFI